MPAPRQWKVAAVHPVPKIPNATEPSQMRPISVLPILSRLTERLVVNKYIMPTMLTSLDLSNQFAYLPIRSTSAALIAIFLQITSLLKSNDSVYMYAITFDYSTAFDTMSHSSVATILSSLLIPYKLL